MTTKLSLIVTFLASLLLPSSDLFAHGGTYRGPGDTVPPGQGPGPGTGGPGDGPTTPGGGPPGTPGGFGGGPTTPGSGPPAPGGGGAGPIGGPGGGSGGRGPMTGGGRKNRPSAGYEQWEFWWEHNKDSFLDLKERLGNQAVQTGSAAFLAGMGRKQVASSSQRLTDEEISRLLIPTLLAVGKESNADIQDSVAIALGRTVKADYANSIDIVLVGYSESKFNSVKEASLLSFGILGNKSYLDILLEKLQDTTEQNLARSFAAISLGLLGETGVFPSLKKMVGSKENSDIQFGAIAALGFLNTPEIQAFLIDQLGNNKLDRMVRAQIPISLARLGCDSVVPDLVKLLGGKKVDIRMQESCVVALGMLGTFNDSYKALTDLITDGRNIQAQHFAFMSLAKIANRESEENVERITKFLLKQLVKPKKHTYTPWTALALGVIGSELYDGLNMSNQWITINNKLVDAYEHQNNPSFKAGIGIGLALAKCNNATDMLYDTFLDTHDNGLKGYTAIALGLLRSADALDTLRIELIKTSDTKYKIQVATALGLLGDKGSTSTLINQLKTAKTLHETSALCKALGLIGDKSAINPLCDLTRDKRVPDLTRAFACVALGLLGEKTQLPWNSKLSVDCNYRIVTPSQVEILDIL